MTIASLFILFITGGQVLAIALFWPLQYLVRWTHDTSWYVTLFAPGCTCWQTCCHETSVSSKHSCAFCNSLPTSLATRITWLYNITTELTLLTFTDTDTLKTSRLTFLPLYMHKSCVYCTCQYLCVSSDARCWCWDFTPQHAAYNHLHFK